MNKPNFIILGAPKGGTTSLYGYLSQHPDVCLAEPKETYFFLSEEYEKGLEFYWDKYFKGWTGQKAIGEATPSYLGVPIAAPRIKECLPEARLIATLRNPVDRVYSAWWMHYCMGNETRSFEEVIQLNFERIKAGIMFSQPVSPVEFGYYAQQINRYLDLFPRSQFKIVFFEDLLKDPHSVVQGVCTFIGVEPISLDTDATAWNVGMDTSENAAKIFGWFSYLARGLGIRSVTSQEMRENLKRKIASFLSVFGRKPRLSKEMRKVLIEHYYSHNRELEKLTGRDLSHWDR